MVLPQTNLKKGLRLTAPRQLDDRTFRDLVALDVRDGVSPEEAAWLRNPEQIERWYEALITILQDLETQFAAMQADLEEAEATLPNAAYDSYRVAKMRWAKGAKFFKTGVERKQREARSLRSAQRGHRMNDALRDERERARNEVRRLRAAIDLHRKTIDPEDVTEQDNELWAVLDEEPFL